MTNPSDIRGDRVRSLDDWLARHEVKFFTALILINLTPLWLFTYFPSLDGPAHLYMADVLVRYNDSDTAIFREFFAINPELEPNYFVFAVLYGLMHLVPPLIAEKILLSAYTVLLPLGLRYAVRAIDPRASVVSFVAFPMTYNFLLHMGFYNFTFGIAFFLFAFGFWLRHSERAGPRQFAGHLGFSLLCYICHLFALAASSVAIAFTVVGTTVREFAREHRAGAADAGLIWRRILSRALLPAAAYAPALLLGVLFMVRGEGDISKPMDTPFGWPDTARFLNLLASITLVSLDAREIYVAKGFSFLLLGMAWLVVARKAERGTLLNGLFFCLIGAVLIYFFSPLKFQVRFLPNRIMPYVWLVIVLWIASQVASSAATRIKYLRAWVIIVVLGLTAAGATLRSVRYAEFNDYIEEYMTTAESIAPNTTLLSLRIDQVVDGVPLLGIIDTFIQASGYIAMERSVVDIKNYQAATGIFPIVFRDTANAYRHLASDLEFVAKPPQVDLARYTARTGKTIDYVIIWGRLTRLDDTPEGQRLANQLAEAYDLIYTSPRRQLANLFRLKLSGQGAPRR